ncbi:hypothetical protein I6A60_38475 [Frankia sp. AgB1.9]|uniref:hypothetical protein n=1 Tax=unclassified Frankia TaxID=2632575 RepID=UPI001931AB0F|nr:MULTISPECIES: hypothetical protein [unclassified Frankia]MBL7491589.1 hypothetical protein [Frankia sp. AgW1.1]MBL7553675.1 hypothetical protein [Frankia sp. AgB1.9]MBL7617675.1 hypothetical protein [Frankia sp. AgB1.8]
MRTFDLDAFDAFDPHERPGEQLLPWEMWERERPWREDSAPVAGTRPAPPPGTSGEPRSGPIAPA